MSKRSNAYGREIFAGMSLSFRRGSPKRKRFGYTRVYSSLFRFSIQALLLSW